MSDKRTTTTSVDLIDREVHSISTKGNETVTVDVTYPLLDRQSITVTETTAVKNPAYPYNTNETTNEVVLQKTEGDIATSSSPHASYGRTGPLHTNLKKGATGALILGHFLEPGLAEEAAIEIRKDLEGILDRDEVRGGKVREKMIAEGYKMPPQMADNLPENLRDFRDLPGGIGDAPSHNLPAKAPLPKGKGRAPGD